MSLSSVQRAVLLTAAVLATVSCSSSDDGGSPAAPSSEGGAYLALGDSVPFGYRGGERSSEYEEAGNFTGYPELVGDALGLEVLNAACPGETTASLLDATAQSNGCENSRTSPDGFRDDYPLHVDYASAEQSQLDYAVETLKARGDVELVTLQVGANDGFLCQATTADRCSADLGVVVDTVGENVATALDALRTDAGYDGRLVVVTYYSLDYADETTTTGVERLNAALISAAEAVDVEVANAFDPFATEAAGGSPVDAGLVLPDDVHPTEKGQRLLADAVISALDG